MLCPLVVVSSCASVSFLTLSRNVYRSAMDDDDDDDDDGDDDDDDWRRLWWWW